MTATETLMIQERSSLLLHGAPEVAFSVGRDDLPLLSPSHSLTSLSSSVEAGPSYLERLDTGYSSSCPAITMPLPTKATTLTSSAPPPSPSPPPPVWTSSPSLPPSHSRQCSFSSSREAGPRPTDDSGGGNVVGGAPLREGLAPDPELVHELRVDEHDICSQATGDAGDSESTLGSEEEEEEEPVVSDEAGPTAVVVPSRPLSASGFIEERRGPSPFLEISTSCPPISSFPLVCSPAIPISTTPEIRVFREKSVNTIPVPAAVARSFDSTNASMVDRRAWLEVEDPKHRYAKNLRMYFKEYDREYQGLAQFQPLAAFWEWLETSGVELEDCPRDQLDYETVHYCTNDNERAAYELYFEDGHLYRRATGEPLTTGPDGWIFVLRDNKLWASEKKTDKPPRFHHSSFFSGECVQAAGLFMVKEGVLKRLYPHSGHYRPTDSHLLTLLHFLKQNGVDLDRLAVDVQLVMKVARTHDANKDRRVRKIDNPYLWTGTHAKDFLQVKKNAHSSRLFDEITFHPLVYRSDDDYTIPFSR